MGESAESTPAWPPATGDGDTEAARALATLCKSYWSPVYAFIRRQGRPPEDAKDLTQGFFQHLLEKKWYANANPDVGKFRTYLLGALKFFLSDEWKKSSAQKRGGTAVHFSIDADEAENTIAHLLTDDVTPDILFDRQWIRSILDAVADSLRAEYERRGKADLFVELRQFLIGGRPWLRPDCPGKWCRRRRCENGRETHARPVW